MIDVIISGVVMLLGIDAVIAAHRIIRLEQRVRELEGNRDPAAPLFRNGRSGHCAPRGHWCDTHETNVCERDGLL